MNVRFLPHTFACFLLKWKFVGAKVWLLRLMDKQLSKQA